MIHFVKELLNNPAELLTNILFWLIILSVVGLFIFGFFEAAIMEHREGKNPWVIMGLPIAIGTFGVISVSYDSKDWFKLITLPFFSVYLIFILWKSHIIYTKRHKSNGSGPVVLTLLLLVGFVYALYNKIYFDYPDWFSLIWFLYFFAVAISLLLRVDVNLKKEPS